MKNVSRRSIVVALASLAALVSGRGNAAPDESRRAFIDQAFAMKRRAVESGDQPFGAVIVCASDIVGYGPSRVVIKKDWTAHAEREAIRDAQTRLGRKDLSDCVMYSTSRPCSDCERAAADAKLARMYVGAEAADAGTPRQMP